MLAAGLGSGLFIANTANADAKAQNGVAADVAIAAVGLAAAEKFLAHRSTNRTVRRFAVDRANEVGRNTIETGETITLVSIVGGTIGEKKVYDPDATPVPAISVLTAALNPMFGYISTATAVRIVQEAGVTSTGTEIAGGAFAGMVAVLGGMAQTMDNHMMRNHEVSCHARIDNIDGGMRLSAS